MSASEFLLLALRLTHSLAAMVWLGGGVYFLLALRPALRERGDSASGLVADAQRAFGDWAGVTTIIMLASGVVLAFDRLANGSGGLLYAALLAAKVLAAIVAFWLAGARPVSRAARRRGAKRSAPELIVSFGLIAFVLGVVLSSVYGRAAT